LESRSYTNCRRPGANMTGPSALFKKLEQPNARHKSGGDRDPPLKQKHQQKHKHKQPGSRDPAFEGLIIAYTACKKSAEGVEKHARSRGKAKAKAWCDMIESILQRTQRREEEDDRWCSRNRKYRQSITC
jgi:hypothetical protein